MKHLSIELSEAAVRFTAIVNNQRTAHSFFFTDKKDYRYKEQLDAFIGECGLKDQEFDEHTVSWSCKRSTLVPANVFGESKADEIFRLCYGVAISASDIDYNRIPEHGIVNVYEIPLWVKSFFVIRHPRSIIQHEGSHLIRGILSENAFKLKVTAVVYDTFFLLVIVKENKLEFYSVFDYLENEDILYHTLFTLQQKGYMSEEGTIQICPGVGSDTNKLEELVTKLNGFTDRKNKKISINSELITKAQQLCV